MHVCEYLCAHVRVRLRARTLCSYSVVGSTTASTSPPSASSSATHSAVGATGACTTIPPDASRTAVMRTRLDTPRPRPMPCSCSNAHSCGRVCARVCVLWGRV